MYLENFFGTPSPRQGTRNVKHGIDVSNTISTLKKLFGRMSGDEGGYKLSV